MLNDTIFDKSFSLAQKNLAKYILNQTPNIYV